MLCMSKPRSNKEEGAALITCEVTENMVRLDAMYMLPPPMGMIVSKASQAS